MVRKKNKPLIKPGRLGSKETCNTRCSDARWCVFALHLVECHYLCLSTEAVRVGGKGPFCLAPFSGGLDQRRKPPRLLLAGDLAEMSPGLVVYKILMVPSLPLLLLKSEKSEVVESPDHRKRI